MTRHHEVRVMQYHTEQTAWKTSNQIKRANASLLQADCVSSSEKVKAKSSQAWKSITCMATNNYYDDESFSCSHQNVDAGKQMGSSKIKFLFFPSFLFSTARSICMNHSFYPRATKRIEHVLAVFSLHGLTLLPSWGNLQISLCVHRWQRWQIVYRVRFL